MSVSLQAYQGPEHEPFEWESANGHAAVLVHGFPGTPAEMRPVAEVLHALGWATRGVLLPGFGREFPEITRHTHDDWANAVGKAIAEQRRNHKYVVLVGNSVGAALAMKVAAQEKVDGLLLFAPFWRANNRLLDGIFPIARHLFPEIRPFKKADFDDPEFRNALARFLPDANLDDLETQAAIRELSLPVDVLGQVRAAGRAGYDAAAAVTAPTTIIQGEEDVISHPKLTRCIADRLAGPVTLHLVAGDHELTRMNNGAQTEIIHAVQAFATSQMARPVPHAGEPLP